MNRLLVIIAIFLVSVPSYGADLITTSPGPDFTTRVHAPWGDFLVYSDDAGAVWIGTEAEYTHAKAAAVARQNGFREMSRGDRPRNEAHFVDRNAPTAVAGNVELGAIYAMVCTHCTSDKEMGRPKISRDDRYVIVSWTQNRATPSAALLIDRKRHESAARINCMSDFGDPHERRCQFIVPRGALNDSMLVIFLEENQAPAAVPFARLGSL